MNKIYIIRVQELFSDGKTTSYNISPAFTSYNACLIHLEGLIDEDKDHYLDGGWEEEDLLRRLKWNRDRNETWVKWDFCDEYSIYYIEEINVIEGEL